MSFLFYLRWSLYHPVINLGLLFFSGGYPATLSEKKYMKFLKKKQVFFKKRLSPYPLVQKNHLFGGVKPVLAAVHHNQGGTVFQYFILK